MEKDKTYQALRNLHFDLMQHKVLAGKETINIDYVIAQVEAIISQTSEAVENEN